MYFPLINIRSSLVRTTVTHVAGVGPSVKHLCGLALSAMACWETLMLGRHWRSAMNASYCQCTRMMFAPRSTRCPNTSDGISEVTCVLSLGHLAAGPIMHCLISESRCAARHVRQWRMIGRKQRWVYNVLNVRFMFNDSSLPSCYIFLMCEHKT